MTTHLAVWLGMVASGFAIVGGIYGVLVVISRKFVSSIRDVLDIGDDEPSVGRQLVSLAAGQKNLEDGQGVIHRRIDNHMDREEDDLGAIRTAMEAGVADVAAELHTHEHDPHAHTR